MGDSMYLWVKSFHLLAVIAWMAGLLYLPRLYVYHAEAQPSGEASAMLKVMERRLLRGIMNPAMIATWALGIWLVMLMGPDTFKAAGWLHVKLVFVLAMSGLHGWLAGMRRAFAEDRNTHSSRFYRVLNEVPAVILVIIVLLVIRKPF